MEVQDSMRAETEGSAGQAMRMVTQVVWFGRRTGTSPEVLDFDVSAQPSKARGGFWGGECLAGNIARGAVEEGCVGDVFEGVP